MSVFVMQSSTLLRYPVRLYVQVSSSALCFKTNRVLLCT